METLATIKGPDFGGRISGPGDHTVALGEEQILIVVLLLVVRIRVILFLVLVVAVVEAAGYKNQRIDPV